MNKGGVVSENGEGSINSKKLAAELGTKPIDFILQKKQFNELIAWFDTELVIRDGEGGHKVNKSLLGEFKKKLKSIKNRHLLPLYAQQLPGVSEVAWEGFIHFYLLLYVQEGIGLRYEYVKQIDKYNIYDHLAEERDIELLMILGILLGGKLLAGKLGKDNQELLHKKEVEENRYQKLKEVNQEKFNRKSRKVWKGKKLSVTALFVENIVSEDDPRSDIVYLDEFLCYHNSYFFEALFLDVVLKNKILFQHWIITKSELLINEDSETYKLFCQLFYLGEKGLFEDDGSIAHDAFMKIPSSYSEVLSILKRKKKISIEKKGREKMEAKIRDEVSRVLMNKIDATFNLENQTINISNIDSAINKIEITIVTQTGKTYAKGIADIEIGTASIAMSQMSFEHFSPQGLSTKNQSWENITKGKGGNKYYIKVSGAIDEERGDNQTDIYYGKIIQSVADPLLGDNQGERNISPDAVTKTKKTLMTIAEGAREKTATILSSDPAIKSKAQIVKISPEEKEKNLRESEILELSAALSLYSEGENNKFMTQLTEGAKWNETKKSLSVSLPVSILTGLHTPAHLFEDVCQLLLQWEATLNEGAWGFTSTTPQEIQDAVPLIYESLMQEQNKEKVATETRLIDDELRNLGLRPRRRTDIGALQDEFGTILTSEPHKILELLVKRIVEMQMRQKGYRLFQNQDSITLSKIKNSNNKQNEWSINYNWTTKKFQIIGLENDKIFTKRLKNSLLGLLLSLNEEVIEAMMIEKIKTQDSDRLREGLKKRLQAGDAQLFFRAPSGDQFIHNVSINNYEEKIASIKKKNGSKTMGYIVYRTSSNRFVPGYHSADHESSYDRCIEKDARMIQARCRATLAQKSSASENTEGGEDYHQDRSPFVHEMARYCKEFFFKEDPHNEETLSEFLEHIGKEENKKSVRTILQEGIKNMLVGNEIVASAEEVMSVGVCKDFFLRKDPNKLEDVIEFLLFLQQKGMDQQNRSGEEPVGIIYSPPVVGPPSDIKKLFSEKKTE